MIDPYKMVFVSAVSFFALCAGILIYKYIFPKKSIRFFILLILFSLLPLISILRQGTYESGDLTQNVYKSMDFYNSLSEGNIIPQWAGNLNATYGYPLFIFVYPLPFYVISIFHFIGFSFIASIKLLIIFSYILSGIGIYLWLKERFGEFSAFVGGIFYLYAPYHLIDTHFRISIGEIISFALLPYCFLFIDKLLGHRSNKSFLLLIISLSLLFLSNPAISLFSIFFINIYAIFNYFQNKSRKITSFIYFLNALLFSLGISAFYWIPVIFESKYTHQALYVSQISFVKIQELLYSTWRFGLLFQGPQGELSFLIGYMQILVIIFCFFFLIMNKFKKYQKLNIIFFLIILFFSIFLLLPVSSFIWDTLSILKNFQFTYRLLFFVSFITATLAAILSMKLNKRIIAIICLFAILQTILNWGNRRTIPQINDSILLSKLPLSTATGEGFQPAMPKWVDPNDPYQKEIPAKHLEIIQGDGKVNEISRSSTKHEYFVDIRKSSYLKENTLYFPNWQVSANNKIILPKYNNPKYPGIITFNLEPGKYKILIEFKNTNLRNFSRLISLISLVILFFSKVLSKFLPFFPKSRF